MKRLHAKRLHKKVQHPIKHIHTNTHIKIGKQKGEWQKDRQKMKRRKIRVIVRKRQSHTQPNYESHPGDISNIGIWTYQQGSFFWAVVQFTFQ